MNSTGFTTRKKPLSALFSSNTFMVFISSSVLKWFTSCIISLFLSFPVKLFLSASELNLYGLSSIAERVLNLAIFCSSNPKRVNVVIAERIRLSSPSKALPCAKSKIIFCFSESYSFSKAFSSSESRMLYFSGGVVGESVGLFQLTL